MPKIGLGVDVTTAARQRISYVFDNFNRVCVSFSGGKDSSVLTHLVMDEAISRGRKVGLLCVDLEAQYKATIDHVAHMFDHYKDHIEPYWVALPMHLRNAVSQYDPFWQCWDPDAKHKWVREPNPNSITDPSYFPFFRRGMEFEEFVPLFNSWFGNGEASAALVGIRSDESLNRYRTIASTKKMTFNGKQWTTDNKDGSYSVYPIYDWKTRDIWIYNGKYRKPYNRIYDLMHKAGVSIHQARLCQPYGDDQRKGLWLYHVLEPETWGKVVARVNGANSGALYAKENGNVTGNVMVHLPDGHTWESFTHLLLSSLPHERSEHYRNKIAVFLKWWQDHGYPDSIPDAHPEKKVTKKFPSWQRICKAILRNDVWMKGLSFTYHKSDAYDAYKKRMKKKREEWGLLNG